MYHYVALLNLLIKRGDLIYIKKSYSITVDSLLFEILIQVSVCVCVCVCMGASTCMCLNICAYYMAEYM